MVEYNFVIRKILPADVYILRQISIDSFTETYAVYNTEADMQLHIESHFNRQQLVNEIENKQNY